MFLFCVVIHCPVVAGTVVEKDELCLCLVRALTVVSQWSDELCLMCLVRDLTVVSQWSDELCLMCLVRTLIGLSGGYFACCLVYLGGTLNVVMSLWREL